MKQYRYFQDNPEDIFECKNCNKCKVCFKMVAANHHAIECNICLKWVHIRYNKLDKKDYNNYQEDEKNISTVSNVLLNLLHFKILTSNIDNIFLTATQYNLTKKINIAIGNGFDLQDDNTDTDKEDVLNHIDCQCYTIYQLNKQEFNSIKYFSILHLNIHSLGLHIEELRIALYLIIFKLDIICITESKIRKNKEPKTDISLDDYQYPIGTPTEATKGGVLIYVKEGNHFNPREDLNIYKQKELESSIINEKMKNNIIGTI